MTINDALEETIVERGRRLAESGNYTASAILLDDMKAFLSKFVVYPSEHDLHAHVLWIGHCWFMDAWESTPRIAFLSPEPASGKSRALEVTEPLVPRPVHAINCTPAYLFRKVSDQAGRPTVLYDEVDTLFGPKANEHEEVGVSSTLDTARARSLDGALYAAKPWKQKNCPPTAL